MEQSKLRFLPNWDSEGETDLVGEGVDRYAKGSCKTKITELELTLSIYEKVLRFEITVQDTIFMTESCSFEKLVHEILRLCLAQLGVRVADDVGKEIPAGAKL